MSLMRQSPCACILSAFAGSIAYSEAELLASAIRAYVELCPLILVAPLTQADPASGMMGNCKSGHVRLLFKDRGDAEVIWPAAILYAQARRARPVIVCAHDPGDLRARQPSRRFAGSEAMPTCSSSTSPRAHLALPALFHDHHGRLGVILFQPRS